MTEAFLLSSITLEKSLSYSFGNILPVEIPLDERPLLYHQLKYLNNNCDRVNLIIPENYKSKVISKYVDLNDTISVSRKNLIHLFQFVTEVAKADRIFILYGDTLYKGNYDFNNKKNYFFINKPKSNYNWGPEFKNKVPSGGMIYNKSKLKELLNNSKNFNDFTENNYEDKDIIKFSDQDWFDFGNVNSYFLSKKNFLKFRHFNNFEIKDFTLVKKSKDIFKIWCEYKWYKKIEKQEILRTPTVKNFNIKGVEAEYEIEYISKHSLSDIYVFGKFPNYFFEKIMEKLAKKIDRLQLTKDLSLDNLMYRKLIEREDDFQNLMKDFNENCLKHIYDKNKDFYKSKKQQVAIFHGDFCFSNILFDFNSFEPIFIDPRGYSYKENGPSIYGPKQYDILKLAHSYLCNYDYIIHDFEIDFIDFETDEFKSKKDFFMNLFKIDSEDLKYGLLNLFLTLIPLHTDNEKRIKNFISLIKKINNHKW